MSWIYLILFHFIDSISTYYCIDILKLNEGNPIIFFLFNEFGIFNTLIIKMIIVFCLSFLIYIYYKKYNKNYYIGNIIIASSIFISFLAVINNLIIIFVN